MSSPQTRAPPLPASRKYGDDLRESVEVARVDDLARGMRIAQRPAEGDVHRAIARKDRAIVAAASDAVLRGDAVFLRQLDDPIDVLARRDVRIVHRANHKTSSNFRIGKAF